MQAGAEIDICDTINHKSALQIAIDNKAHKIEATLRKYGNLYNWLKTLDASQYYTNFVKKVPIYVSF